MNLDLKTNKELNKALDEVKRSFNRLYGSVDDKKKVRKPHLTNQIIKRPVTA
jgi:hypothetical protein